MERTRRQPGIVVSAGVHAVLLAASLVAFSNAPAFKDAQEAIPVEIITETDVNQITKGEEKAKPEENKPRVDTQAEQPEQRPTPPVNEAKQDIPTPPPPLKRIPDPAEADTPAPEPPKVAALPPQRPPEPEPKTEPEPPAPTPPVRPPQPKAEPKPEPPKPVAKEAPEPPPPPARPKPEPQKQAEAKPEPETPSKPAPLPPRRPPPRKVEDKPKPDQMAKLVESTKNVKPSPARPRSGEEHSEPARKYDPSAISKILSREPAQQRGSAGPTPRQTAALGRPNATAQKMSPSMSAQLNGLLIEQYKRCWNYVGTVRGEDYQPQVQVTYASNGALIGRPTLRNPSSNPAYKSLGDSVLRAIQRCNPLRIPPQFAPYYNEWKDLLLRFSPEDMMG